MSTNQTPSPQDDRTPEWTENGQGAQGRPDKGGAPAGKEEADPATGGEGAAGAGGSGGFGT